MPYIGKSPLHGNYSKLDDFSGDFDGSDATHALATNGLAVTPVTEAAVLISINGVIQEPTTDYTVSGTNITFTTAPASGANFFGVVLGEQLAIGTPSDSTITAAKLASTFFTGATDIGAAIVDADLFLMDDGAGGTLRKTTASRLKTYIGGSDPASADGDSLGTASLEWSDLYLADSGVIYFGNDQDVTITHDPDDGLFFKSTATSDDNPFLLTLQTGETDMAADDVMGKIAFQAPDEGTGTDAILVAAAIQARAEGDFSSSSNATSLDFMTGSSAAASTNMTLDSAGKLTVKGELAIAAASGVLETNANFVNSVIFGPAVDGMSWKGLWNSASLFSSLMLATIETSGGSSELNVWDLTAQTGGTISTTPLYTVAIGVTATSVDAAMGYVVIGSGTGVKFYDPHDGAWAQRTVGWPRYLSTSSDPALGSNDVDDVTATVLRTAALDPRTDGPMPTFRVSSDSTTNAVLAFDGIPHNAEVTSTHTASWDGRTGIVRESNNSVRMGEAMRLEIKGDNGDEILHASGTTEGLHMAANEARNVLAAGPSPTGSMFAVGSASGMDIADMDKLENAGYNGMIASVNRTYNTGYMIGKIRGAWLANSKTADRSHQAHTLVENGTVPTGAVESGAELTAYGPFSDSNFLNVNSHADWDEIGTGSYYMSLWLNSTGESTTRWAMGISNSGDTIQLCMRFQANGLMSCVDDGASARVETNTSTGWDDSKWHKFDFVRVSSSERYAYVDGVRTTTSTGDAGSLNDDTNLPFSIGSEPDGNTGGLVATKLALCKMSATAPSYAQIRAAYEAEKGMFVASAECLLQSGSTDEVLDIDIDPLGSNKILVTQADAITIFDGLVVDSKPTVNSGNSEKGKLWGDLRVEQNSDNIYVTAPAHDQAQVNEMVRSLSSSVHGGVDMSKAKVWCVWDQASNTIHDSYNVKSITLSSTGITLVEFGVPFKTVLHTDKPTYASAVTFCPAAATDMIWCNVADTGSLKVYCVDSGGSAKSNTLWISLIIFGDLENE